MQSVDINGSGYIDYSEFVAACVDKRKFFSEDRLKTAFGMFDSDDDGFIGIDELR
jgi:calcium-dependent protein kinase